MIELIGIFLLAGTLTSVAVINAVHRPFEMRSEDPHDFDITAVEAYNRLLAALSTGKIKGHVLQLKETVDPLYFIAALDYADSIGNKCAALVTFDVVEGYKSTTTIRWTCKFLKWCEKQTAYAVRTLLDQWIIDHLGSESQSSASVVLEQFSNGAPEQSREERYRQQVNFPALPATFEQTKSAKTDKTKPESSSVEKAGALSQKFQKKLRKPPSPISPSPQQFQIKLKDAYIRVSEKLQKSTAIKTSWEVKEQIEDAYIIAHLNISDVISRTDSGPPEEGSAIVNIDFSEPESEQTTITWSCEFNQWYDDAGIRDIEQFINAWIAETLSNPTPYQPDGQTGQTVDRAAGPDVLTSASATEAAPAPGISTVRSNYPREFAYLKLMKRISSAPQKNTKWKLIECDQGNRIVARLTYHSPFTPEAICNVHSTLDFEGDASSGIVNCTFIFSPDSDAQMARNFILDTEKWIELSLR